MNGTRHVPTGLTVRDVPGMGEVLFATREYKRGDVVLVEKPLIMSTSFAGDDIEKLNQMHITLSQIDKVVDTVGAECYDVLGTVLAYICSPQNVKEELLRSFHTPDYESAGDLRNRHEYYTKVLKSLAEEIPIVGQVNLEELIRTLFIFMRHGVEIGDPSRRTIGIFHLASKFSHECTSNVLPVFETDIFGQQREEHDITTAAAAAGSTNSASNSRLANGEYPSIAFIAVSHIAQDTRVVMNIVRHHQFCSTRFRQATVWTYRRAICQCKLCQGYDLARPIACMSCHPRIQGSVSQNLPPIYCEKRAIQEALDFLENDLAQIKPALCFPQMSAGLLADLEGLEGDVSEQYFRVQFNFIDSVNFMTWSACPRCGQRPSHMEQLLMNLQRIEADTEILLLQAENRTMELPAKQDMMMQVPLLYGPLHWLTRRIQRMRFDQWHDEVNSGLNVKRRDWAECLQIMAEEGIWLAWCFERNAQLIQPSVLQHLVPLWNQAVALQATPDLLVHLRRLIVALSDARIAMVRNSPHATWLELHLVTHGCAGCGAMLAEAPDPAKANVGQQAFQAIASSGGLIGKNVFTDVPSIPPTNLVGERITGTGVLNMPDAFLSCQKCKGLVYCSAMCQKTVEQRDTGRQGRSRPECVCYYETMAEQVQDDTVDGDSGAMATDGNDGSAAAKDGHGPESRKRDNRVVQSLSVLYNILSKEMTGTM
eukprot:Clim_evm85s144 gene=Clim_evmTU85s144